MCNFTRNFITLINMKNIRLCIVIMLILCSVINISAKEDNESIRLGRIDSLYNERNNLCIEFDKNVDRIKEIDRTLEELDVETLSFEEVKIIFENAENVGNVDGPKATVPSTSTSKWTSTRTTYTLNNKTYNLQIIRAVNNSGTSGQLYKSWATTQLTRTGSQQAGQVETLRVAIDATLQAVIPTPLKTGYSFFTMFRDLCSSMTSSTTFSNYKASYTTTVNAQEVYVFVRYNNETDANQMLTYVGNSTAYVCTTTTPAAVAENGIDLIAGSKTQQGTLASKYFSSFNNYSCTTYDNYRQNGTIFTVNKYQILTFKEYHINGGYNSYWIPRENHGFF